ncbi:hypothetical protein PTKIN_Ptkin11bG0033800 [Pterospermum kingtungense]
MGKTSARLSKRALERRSWPNFGDAVREDVGSRLTMVSTEEIFLERPRPPGSHIVIFIDFIYSLSAITSTAQKSKLLGGLLLFRKPTGSNRIQSQFDANFFSLKHQ